MKGKSEVVISPEEYGALPASIRKKYFSSQERLQIARQYAAECRKRQRKQSWIAPLSHEPVQNEILDETGPRTVVLPRRSPNPRLTVSQEVIPEADALWSLSLPDKVKRRQFSKEEQVLLKERCESALKVESPKAAFQLCQTTPPDERNEAITCLSRRRSSVPSLSIDEEAFEAIASAAETFSLRGQDADDEDEMAILSLYARRRSTFASIEANLSPPPPTQAVTMPKPNSKRSFRRSFALRPIPLPAPRLAPMPSPPSSAELADRPARLSRHRTEPNFSLPILSPSATHYQDPTARATLQSLASPEAFDEAIEYGFPSPSAHPPDQSFELARSYSLTFSSSSGDESSASAGSPATPTSVHQAPESAHLFASTSLDSGSSLPLQKPMTHDEKIPDINPTPSMSKAFDPSEREMTLHMTLTRPDLRDPGQTLHGSVKSFAVVESLPMLDQQDPLALDRLPVCDDPSGSQGAFAVKEDSHGKTLGLKKVWKSLRGK